MAAQNEQEYLKVLGEKIRYAREEDGISQRELAERAGMSESTISKLERGQLNPTLTQIIDIALAQGGDPADLVGSLNYLYAPVGDAYVNSIASGLPNRPI